MKNNTSIQQEIFCLLDSTPCRYSIFDSKLENLFLYLEFYSTQVCKTFLIENNFLFHFSNVSYRYLKVSFLVEETINAYHKENFSLSPNFFSIFIQNIVLIVILA